MKLVWSAIRSGLVGAAIALDWYYLIMFDKKLPRWLAWTIGIILVPVNWLIIAYLFITKKATMQDLKDGTKELMVDVIDARNA